MRYLTISELIYINGRLLNNAQIMTGKQKVRDLVMLQAAEARPAASAFGQDAYPTLAEKAAALLHALARNHPFTDGNKRTATVAALFLLAVNGQRVAWQPQDALDHILAVAEGREDWDVWAAWLPTQADEASAAPDPDEARDKTTIDRLIDEQRWLLHELESR
jgi:death on curing protein